MVDAVSTISAQSTSAPRPAPVAPSPVAAVGTGTGSAPVQDTQTNFISSSIVMNNLQNVAILEYRSSKTGEIVEQFPSEGQIDAFKAAERLREISQQAAVQQAPTPSARSASPNTPQTSQAAAPAPATTPPPAAPVASAGPAGSGGAASSGGGTTTSVIA